MFRIKIVWDDEINTKVFAHHETVCSKIEVKTWVAKRREKKEEKYEQVLVSWYQLEICKNHMSNNVNYDSEKFCLVGDEFD